MGGCGQRQVLESTTHSYMLFSQIRVEGADIPIAIDIQLNRSTGYFEEPGLSVVWTSGENRGANQSHGSIAGLLTPVFPGLVGGTLANTENALVVGMPDSTACHNNSNGACALQE